MSDAWTEAVAAASVALHHAPINPDANSRVADVAETVLAAAVSLLLADLANRIDDRAARQSYGVREDAMREAARMVRDYAEEHGFDGAATVAAAPNTDQRVPLDSSTLPVPHLSCPSCGASIRATQPDRNEEQR